MDFDRMSFPEAIEDLAGRLGLEVPREGGDDSTAPKRVDDSAYDLMAQGRQLLARPARARRARAAIRHREARSHQGDHRALRHRLRPQLLERPAPTLRRQRGRGASSSPTWGSSSSASAGRCARASGTTTASATGSCSRSAIARGRVIAFGGRIIDQGEPKYLNSPETDALPQRPRALRPLGNAAVARTLQAARRR